MHVAAQNRRHSDVLLVLIIIAIIKFQGRRPSQALEPKAITGLRLAAIETAAWCAVGRLPGPPDRGRRAVSFLLDLGRPLPATRATKLPPESPPRAAPVSASDSARRYNFLFPPGFTLLHLCCEPAGVSARGLRGIASYRASRRPGDHRRRVGERSVRMKNGSPPRMVLDRGQGRDLLPVVA